VIRNGDNVSHSVTGWTVRDDASQNKIGIRTKIRKTTIEFTVSPAV
jgi:hypothetical protein